MKIKVNGVSYKVELVDKLDDALGLFDGDNRVIKIRKQPLDKMRSTIIHETSHCYLYSFAFSQVELNEEVICDFIETYGERIIKDSDKIFKNLTR